MDVDTTNGTTVPATMENGSKIKSMAEASTTGRMEESMTVCGKTTICKVKESTHGKMVENMKESTLKTVSMVLESTPGKMDVNTKVNGIKANSTAMEFTDKPMETSVVDAGKMESVCCGTTSRKLMKTNKSTTSRQLMITNKSTTSRQLMITNKSASFQTLKQKSPRNFFLPSSTTGTFKNS